MQPTQCKYCGFSVSETNYFCPNCGKKLKEPPQSTSIAKQIWVYAISILLPPLGLWPGIKYLRGNSILEKRIGLIAITLTIVSTIITIWLTFSLLNTPLLFGGSGSQLNQLQNLGY